MTARGGGGGGGGPSNDNPSAKRSRSRSSSDDHPEVKHWCPFGGPEGVKAELQARDELNERVRQEAMRSGGAAGGRQNNTNRSRSRSRSRSRGGKREERGGRRRGEEEERKPPERTHTLRTGGSRWGSDFMEPQKTAWTREQGPEDMADYENGNNSSPEGYGRTMTREFVLCAAKEDYGRIIGSRGGTVKRIQADTGARVEVLRDQGRCAVSGTRDQVAHAVDTIQRLFWEEHAAEGEGGAFVAGATATAAKKSAQQAPTTPASRAAVAAEAALPRAGRLPSGPGRLVRVAAGSVLSL
jgi:hypothetical protein